VAEEKFVADPALDEWIATHSFPPAKRGKVSNSYWRESAHHVISQVLERNADERGEWLQDPAEILGEIDKAYPFGQKDLHPYKMWLEERKEAVKILGLE
jgi:hypothetical protein